MATNEHLAEVRHRLAIARDDPQEFVEVVLAAERPIVPHQIHDLIHYGISQARANRQHIVLVMPPEHGKTQQVSKRLAWEVGKRPGLRVGYVSADSDLSERNLISTRKVLTSEICRLVFPDMQPDVTRSTERGQWNLKRLYMAGQPEPAFEVFTRDGASEGARLDILWLDDCVPRECSRSEAEREAARSAINGTWLNRLTEGGLAIITNNCWHRDDPISQMRQSRSYLVIWVGYEETDRLYFKIYHAPPTWRLPTAGALDLWPVWSKERLELKRAEDRLMYKRLFQQQAVIAEEMRFPPAEEWKTYERHELPRPDETYGIYAVLDPAGGRNAKKDDFAAFIGVMVDKEGILYVTDCWIRRAPPALQVEIGFTIHDRWLSRGYRLSRFKFEVLPKDEQWILPLFERRSRELRDEGRACWDLPYACLNPYGKKETHIEAVISYFEKGWIRFPKGFRELAASGTEIGDNWARLIAQTEDFPFGDHDDGPDALSLAILDAKEGALDIAKRRAAEQVLSEEQQERAAMERFLADYKVDGKLKTLTPRSEWGISELERQRRRNTDDDYDELVRTWTQ